MSHPTPIPRRSGRGNKRPCPGPGPGDRETELEELRSLNATLIKECTDLTARLGSADESNAALEQDVATLQQKVATLFEERTDLTARLDSADESYSRFKSERDALQKELLEHVARLREAEALRSAHYSRSVAARLTAFIVKKDAELRELRERNTLSPEAESAMLESVEDLLAQLDRCEITAAEFASEVVRLH